MIVTCQCSCCRKRYLNEMQNVNFDFSRETCDEVDRLYETVKDAVTAINQMQNKIKPFMNINSVMGKEVQEAFNIGALFNSKYPKHFNDYLEQSPKEEKERGNG